MSPQLSIDVITDEIVPNYIKILRERCYIKHLIYIELRYTLKWSSFRSSLERSRVKEKFTKLLMKECVDLKVHI